MEMERKGLGGGRAFVARSNDVAKSQEVCWEDRKLGGLKKRACVKEAGKELEKLTVKGFLRKDF